MSGPGQLIEILAAAAFAVLAAVGTAQAVCGDSVVEPAEQCDDGGVTAGDGCTASCTYEDGFWYPNGPEGSHQLNSMAVHPADSDIVYAKPNHGVYKTTDGGATWHRVATAPNMDGFGPIVVDPTTPSTIYFGTNSGGLFKSVDSGSTWQSASLPMSGVESLAVDPNNGTIYAGNGGLYKSTNGGTSWTDIKAAFGSGQMRCLGVAADGTVYGGTDDSLRKSSDGGANWVAADSGIPVKVMRGIIPTSDPSIVYTVAAGLLYRTTDAGVNWTQVIAPGSGYAAAVAMDASDPDHFAIPNELGISVTTDGGATWSTSSSGLLETGGGAMAMGISPSEAIYFATNLGVHRSTDGGATWSPRRTGMRELGHTALSVSSGSSDVLYVSTFGVGVYYSSDHGRTWSGRNSGLDTSVDFLEQDPTDSDSVYAAGNGGLFHSADAGLTWTEITLPTPNVEAFALDPADPSRLYVGRSTVWTSDDAGATWTEGGTETQNENVRWLRVGLDGTVYTRTDVGLYASSDHAASWTNLVHPSSPAGMFVAAPGDPNTLYAATATGVFRSTDAGQSWTAINTNLPSGEPRQFYVIAIDPNDPDQLFAAGQRGAFHTSRTTIDWKALGASTQRTLLRDLEFDQATSTAVFVTSQFGGLVRASQICGNGSLDPGETCDDGNVVGTDGCSATCQAHECANCTGEPSVCTPKPFPTPCTDDGLFCNGAEACFNGACLHRGDPCDGSCTLGTDECLANLPGCFPSGNPCIPPPECQDVCYEATDSCGGNPADVCGSGFCGEGLCTTAGSCVVPDGDSDTFSDTCDVCPDDADAGQANSDCDDETFLTSGGCAGPQASQHAGCCDGGDLCDVCPGLADNTQCTSGGAASGVVDETGGTITSDMADIEVPAGALSEDTVLTLAEAAPVIPEEEVTFSLAEGVAATIAALPEGTHFAAPVVITLRWNDRDDDGLVDGGTCISGTDDDESCDSDADCQSGDCTTDATSLSESSLTLKRNGQRFSAAGFGADPFTCADHLSGACETAAATCSSPAGTGTAAVAGCCNPDTNSWTFQTCDFSEFFVGRTAGDLILGGGSSKTDCGAEWSVRNPHNDPFLGKKGTINPVQTCIDGDPTCDTDGTVNDSCTFEVALCANVDDPRVKIKGAVACPSEDFRPLAGKLKMAQWLIKKPRPDSKDTEAAANAVALRDAVANLGSPGNGVVGGNHSEILTFTTPIDEIDACTPGVAVVVSIKDGETTARSFKFQAVGSAAPNGKKGSKDSDGLTLVCVPHA